MTEVCRTWFRWQQKWQPTVHREVWRIWRTRKCFILQFMECFAGHEGTHYCTWEWHPVCWPVQAIYGRGFGAFPTILHNDDPHWWPGCFGWRCDEQLQLLTTTQEAIPFVGVGVALGITMEPHHHPTTVLIVYDCCARPIFNHKWQCNA